MEILNLFFERSKVCLIKSFLLFLFITSFLVTACSKENSDSELEPEITVHPVAVGSFVQPWFATFWDDKRWQEEFSMLKEAGMKYLVLDPTLQSDENDISNAIYPSDLPNVKNNYSIDLVDNCLRNAEKAGFKVFIGLNFHKKWWGSNTSEWISDQMELGNQVAGELFKKYKEKYPKSFYGWYWGWEIDNLRFKTAERQDALIKALNINIDYLNEITPNMPFMFCPFVNHRVGSVTENRDMWMNILPRVHFRKGDIFAPQDCVGAGGLELHMVDEWFKTIGEAVDLVPGLEFWSDAETFDQRFWTAATLDRFVKQMEIVQPYVSNIISFAYSHYYSTFQKSNEFHKLYQVYVKTGKLPTDLFLAPVKEMRVSSVGGKILVEWEEPPLMLNIVGYYIYRDGVLIGNVQYDGQNKCETKFNDSDKLSKGKHIYKVSSYAANGDESTTAMAEVVV